MAHFAHVNNGIVDSVIVISRNTLAQANGWYCPACLSHKPFNEWVQTSYNTKQGKYKLGKDDAEKLALKMTGDIEDIKARDRKHYAGIGYTYDSVDDVFLPPKPFNSWKLDKETATWSAPKTYPKDEKNYIWDETLLDWVIQE